jgi:hypothetical protein
MSTRAFGIGVQSIAGKLVDWVNDTIKVMQIDLTQVDTAIKAITALTNATPMVATAASHGFANGDIIVIQGVVGNPAANNTFKVGGVTTNTVNLLNLDGSNSTGAGVWTSGGTMLDMTLTATIADINAGRVGTDQTLGSKTNVGGLLNAAAPTFTGVSGFVSGLVFYKDGGSDAASIPLFLVDGKMMITFASTKASTATAIDIQKASGALASGVTMTTTGGILVTNNASLAQFGRSMTVLSLPGTVTAGDTADVATTGAGLPFTGGGGSYTYTPDAGANKLFNLNAL